MSRRSTAELARRGALIGTAVVLLLLTSCAGLVESTASERQAGDRGLLSKADPDGSGSASGSQGESDAESGEGKGDRGGSRTATLLPPSVSQVWEVDDTGLYLTADEGKTQIVAFDLTTGIELYRVDTHPAGRFVAWLPPCTSTRRRSCS